MSITLTHYQIKALLDLSEASGDPDMYDTLVLIEGNDTAHSGAGLYVYAEEAPEEGAIYLALDDADADRAEATGDAKIAKGEVIVN